MTGALPLPLLGEATAVLSTADVLLLGIDVSMAGRSTVNETYGLEVGSEMFDMAATGQGVFIWICLDITLFSAFHTF